MLRKLCALKTKASPLLGMRVIDSVVQLCHIRQLLGDLSISFLDCHRKMPSSLHWQEPTNNAWGTRCRRWETCSINGCIMGWAPVNASIYVLGPGFSQVYLRTNLPALLLCNSVSPSNSGARSCARTILPSVKFLLFFAALVTKSS